MFISSFWFISYFTNCLKIVPECAISMTTNRGVITSPGYPYHSYGNSIECTWEIKIASGKKIEIDFISFDVNHNPVCEWVSNFRILFWLGSIKNSFILDILIHWHYTMVIGPTQVKKFVYIVAQLNHTTKSLQIIMKFLYNFALMNMMETTMVLSSITIHTVRVCTCVAFSVVQKWCHRHF